MAINTTPLNESYLSPTQLTAMLTKLEGYVALPYSDGKGLATIGIGIALQGERKDGSKYVLKGNLALVLRKIGVFEASDESAPSGETVKEKNARYTKIVDQFAKAIDNYGRNLKPGGANEVTDSENALQKALDTVVAQYIPGGRFRLSSEAAAKDVKKDYIVGYEIGPFRDLPGAQGRLDAKLTGLLVAPPSGLVHDTREYMALMSMSFNGENLIGRKLRTALGSGDRAEAWYEIRYGSNGGGDKPGTAKRRYWEAEVFGLYDDQGANVTPQAAKQTYRMFTRHRREIRNYEALYGVAFDGSLGTELIEGLPPLLAANRDFKLTGAALVNAIQVELSPARDALITELRASYPALATVDLSDGAGYLTVNILIDPIDTALQPAHAATLDARDYDSSPFANNILVGEGGDDYLRGGKGDDVLIGGTGMDTYYWQTGDGADRIIEQREPDGSIRGRIVIFNAETGTTVVKEISAGTFYQVSANLWKSADGQLTLTHNSPWMLDTGDGGTIELGDDFQEGDFGITLVDMVGIPGSYNPVVAQYGNVVGSPYPLWRTFTLQGTAGHDELSAVLPESIRDDGSTRSGVYGIHYGGAGDDRIAVHDDRDVLYGEDGNDILIGSIGWGDLFPGGGPLDGIGADFLSGGVGADRLYGAGEMERDDFIEASGQGQGSGLRGDWLAGASGDDELMGSDGNDVLSGGGGSDLLMGGLGGDYILADVDYFSDTFGWAVSFDSVNQTYVFTGTAQGAVDRPADSAGDQVHAGAGDDFIWAGDGGDIVYGEDGVDYIAGEWGHDNLFGGDGADYITGDAAPGVIPEAEHGDDFIDGGDGEDVLFGGGGNDVLFGGDGVDEAYGDAAGIAQGGDDQLFGEGGNDLLVGGGGADAVYGGDGEDRLDGDAEDVTEADQAADALYGDSGNDQIKGYGGDDYLDGGDGDDLLFADAGDDVLDGGAGDDTVDGGDGADALAGGDGNDGLWGGSGNDALTGGAGRDFLDGGDGDDVYTLATGDSPEIGGLVEGIVDSSGNDRLELVGDSAAYAPRITQVGGGADLLLEYSDGDRLVIVGGLLGSVETFALFDGELTLSALLARSTDPINYTGGAAADTLYGSGGGDSLGGGGGDDTVSGQDGNDTLYGDAGDDHLEGGAGDDMLYGNAGGDMIVGGEGADTLYGEQYLPPTEAPGADTLDGGAGNDELYGRGGDDTYVFARGYGHDRIGESGGMDTLRLNGVLAGEVTLSRIGEDLVVAIAGDRAQAWIVQHFTPGDTAIEQIVFDDQTWDAAAIASNVIAGTPNTMIGGPGNNTFQVDHVGDTIVEGLNQGTDIVQSWVTYTLPANVEDLTLTGALDVDGRGNSLSNTILGSAGDNWLRGEEGNDTLSGGAGDDQLNGGAGADTLSGGMGDDIYFVDSSSDTVLEGIDEGVDTVITTGSVANYTLDSNLENLTIQSNYSFTLRATGNELDNVIRGRAGVLSDEYDGGAGADTMIAAGGLFFVDNPADQVVTEVGSATFVKSEVDWVLAASQAELELLSGTAAVYGAGNAAANTLTGNANDNYLEGFEGNDVILGAQGADTLVGGLGDDIYILAQGRVPDGSGYKYIANPGAVNDDIVIETAGEGTDTVRSLFDFTLPESVENLELLSYTGGPLPVHAIQGTGNDLDNRITGNSANNLLSGGAGNDILDGGAGHDTLDGGPGTDTLIGGAGNDTFLLDAPGDIVTEGLNGGTDTVVAPFAYTLVGSDVENLTLTGTDAIDGTGNDLDNVLRGNGAANRLAGGAGNDSYYVSSADTIEEGAGQGNDSVFADITYSLAATNLENLTLTGTEAINATGNGVDNILSGNSANNTLDGAGGNDVMAGGLGDDTYLVDAAGDSVSEDYDGGSDTVISSVAFILSDYVEKLTLTGTNAISGDGNDLGNVLTGNGAANTLTGWGGNDTLIGSGGADTLRGGAGDDTYWIDGSDVVTENSDEGTDTIIAAFTYVLGNTSNVENLTLVGASPINGTGNDLNNLLTGNGAANTLTGGLGDDTLIGGGGADQLIGGAGEDTYYLDAADVVTELSSGGTDTVIASFTYTLGDNVENLLLTGAAAINGTGNGLDNILVGNGGANVLSGGVGNDTYYVSTGDSISEGVTQGTDTVYADISWTLGAELEDLTLTGTAAINATGNGVSNVLTGNSGNNVLDGKGGSDTMYGGMGNDTYVVDAVGDIVTEYADEGIDAVVAAFTYVLGNTSNVENLTLAGASPINGTGNDLNNVLAGNGAANTLTGGPGNDTLVGGGGADQLVGGAGDDTYWIDAADTVTEVSGGGMDTVIASFNDTLGGEVENLVLTGSAAINGTGNGLENILVGNSGINVLSGGAGNDSYYVGTGDSISEGVNQGTDIVYADVSWTLGAELDNLTLTGTSAINATGNGLSNVLTGNGGNNVLDGKGGSDTMLGGMGDDLYVVDSVGDVVTEYADEGIDTVYASVTHELGDDVEKLLLTGSAGINGSGNGLDNVLVGNSGANTLSGKAGNDTYLIGVGDAVLESENEGEDVVYSSVAYTLSAQVEHLFLSGTSGISGTGNALDNLVAGNAGSNALAGGTGNDALQGLAGNDLLTNSGGNSLFDGGAGSDALQGGTGNDWFAGGLDNDSLVSGGGRDVIAFNRGDGQDSLNVAGAAGITLSLGGGIAYADLNLRKVGDDLVLETAVSAESVTFAGWYALGSAGPQTMELQLLTEPSGAYNGASPDSLLNRKVQNFDFSVLVEYFDDARTANPMLDRWALTNGLLDAHLGGSDAEALGGDLAYRYGLNGNLSGIGVSPARDVLVGAGFGAQGQALRTLEELQTGAVRLA